MSNQDPNQYPVVNNREKKRFEVKIDNHLGRVEYMLVQDRIIFTHTEVAPALEGKGIASRLAKAALEYARENQFKIMPLCPYIAGYMKRHKEYNDLLMPGFNLG